MNILGLMCPQKSPGVCKDYFTLLIGVDTVQPTTLYWL